MNVYVETFKSPGNQPTQEAALEILEMIRKNHPESRGWREIAAGVKQREDGSWFAWRKHERLW